MRVTPGRPWVIKVGGRLCEDAAARRRLALSCARLGRPLVIVHGGGDQVSRLQRATGAEPRFVDGRRVTTPEDIVTVEMALAGGINKTLVRDLTAAGLEAAGISGCDGGMIRCSLVAGLGRVGTPAAVDPALPAALLASGFTPVVAPVSLGPSGEAVNVNADEAACALAVALRAERLLLLSDVAGVIDRGAPLRSLAPGDLERLISAGTITGGMVPKIRSAAVATARGVGEVRIAGFRGGSLARVAGTRVLAPGERSCA